MRKISVKIELVNNSSPIKKKKRKEKEKNLKCQVEEMKARRRIAYL
jgi:hypothetical protein